jgi:hypothetical protein
MSTVQSMFWPTQMFDHRDYRFGLWIAENTLPKATFMFYAYPNSTVACVAGRQLFIGYGGWVGSHGLSNAREFTQSLLSRLPGNADGFRANNISYVVESTEISNSKFKPGNATHWKAVYRDNVYSVYRLL